MSKLDTFEYDFLRMTFCGKPITNICASGGTTRLWIALLTADPTDSGSTAAEGGYAAYLRQPVDRSTVGFTVSSGVGAAKASVSPTTALDFPGVATTSTGTFTHFTAYMTSAGQSSEAVYNGTVTPNINFSQGVTPRITTGSSVTED